jgi:hypothetical protein
MKSDPNFKICNKLGCQDSIAALQDDIAADKAPSPEPIVITHTDRLPTECVSFVSQTSVVIVTLVKISKITAGSHIDCHTCLSHALPVSWSC